MDGTPCSAHRGAADDRRRDRGPHQPDVHAGPAPCSIDERTSRPRRSDTADRTTSPCRTSLRAVHHASGDEREQALQILNRWRGTRVHFLVPYGEVGVFAVFDGADAILEEDLMRGPYRVRLQRDVNVDGLRGAEWRAAVRAIQRFA